MKTDISIPNPLFEAATELAQKLDMSLSELYTAALAAYLATYENEDEEVTARLNEVYATVRNDKTSPANRPTDW